MCFEIDPYAPKPKTKFAYKIFHVNVHGNLESQYQLRRRIHWKLDVRAKVEVPRGTRFSAAGLYVHSSLKRAREVFDIRFGTPYALVKVEALPEHYAHSSKVNCEGSSGRARVYSQLTPRKVIAISAGVWGPVRRKYLRLIAKGKKTK